VTVFIVRRVLWTVLVLFAITLLVFLIFFATPGIDPARALAGRNPSPQVLAAIRAQFGLNKPLPVQYLLMMKNLFITRSLVSYSDQGQLVVPEIVAAAPATLSLVFGAALIWVVAAIGMGVAAAVFRGTFIDPLLMVVALIGISMPVFWLSEVANLITQSKLHNTFLFSWVPPLGYTPLTSNPLLWFEGLVIPWITLSVLYVGLYARVLRASLLETASEDYVRTARAKGLTETRVLVFHTLRTSMITFVSLFGLDFGVLVGGGALLTEVVFGIHGVGFLTYQSLATLDLPVIMATVVYGAFFIVLANTLVDILYGWLDPRVRISLWGRRCFRSRICGCRSTPRTGWCARWTASPSSWPKARRSASSASPAPARA
jgi:peptide/nickel transport system permease protein